ncbi:GNAT family N-acetyltransferase [Winogradskya consettensis]|uniref:N-acetyltransferase n=1 Tax=Winogradskya consettensis TaxID=113560 RepID=A0A919SZ71_9ACTN|nr:GNAT family N-acetyltransferase [Actinoplanes consettensis]GIM81340.1 N-acetyltransferase [Actinoplanes consettensis]
MGASQIETERLILRQWSDADIMPWAAMNADPLVREYFTEILNYEQSARSLGSFRSELDERGWGWWAVEIAETGQFVGFAGLDVVDDGLPFKGVEVGWRLAREAWGHGYATEAGHACLDYGFDVLRLDEILALTAVGNVRSRAVMHRLGMTYDPADDFTDPDVPGGHAVLYRSRSARMR